MTVVDLGAATGGEQIAEQRVGGMAGTGFEWSTSTRRDGPILGSGQLTIDPPVGRVGSIGDALRREADVVLDEMKPATGTITDHPRHGLAEAALDLAEDILAPGGTFLCKVLQGGASRELVARLNRSFAKVRHVKPKASRAESAEMYVVATGFRGVESAA